MSGTTTTSEPGIYFATVQDPVTLAREMKNKISLWRKYCKSTGMYELWRKKMTNYYGVARGGNTSQQVTRGGTEGELSLIKVNDLHSLLQGQLVMITGQRPAGVAKAINGNSQSVKSAKIGTALSEYYMTEEGFEEVYVNAAKVALLLDEGWTMLSWDKSAGDPVAIDMETGQPEMSGDSVLGYHSPWNVARDPGLKIADQKWNIVTIRGNKYDFAAQYPKFSEYIKTVSEQGLPECPLETVYDGSDACFAHLLIHDRTASVQSGRYSLLIGDKIVLDSELPFEDYPLDMMTSDEVIDGPTGYCAANDIMALEEVTDSLHSICTSNATTFGGQCLVAPQNSGLDFKAAAQGLRVFELPTEMIDKFKRLDLLQTPPEVYKYIDLLGTKKDQAVGSNSVVKGAPEGALAGASGSAFALIQTQAISFNSLTQRAFFKMISSSMTKNIRILAKYADTPRIARLVGKTNSAGLKEFKYTGQDLKSISSIVYEMVNPISQTFGGRMAMADNLLRIPGMLTSPKQYITLATTGQLEVLTQPDENKQLLILEENEWLAEGKPVEVIITQNHKDHIASHEAQITLDMIATDRTSVGRILDHIQSHINIWTELTQINPGILIATGQEPMFQGNPQQAQPQLEGQPDEGGNNPEIVGDGSSPVERKAGEIQEPNLPNLPDIAGTDQQPTIPGVNVA